MTLKNVQYPFDLDALDKITSLTELASAILTADEYIRLHDAIESFFVSKTQAERDLIFANYAINRAVVAERESAAWGVDTSIVEEVYDLAKRLATKACDLWGDPMTFMLETDEPCMMWASPWSHTVTYPDEYAFVQTTFMMQDGEASFTGDEKMIESDVIVHFLNYVKPSFAPDDFHSLVEQHYAIDGENLLPCVKPLLAA